MVLAEENIGCTHKAWKIPRAPRPNSDPKTGKYWSKNFIGQPISETVSQCQYDARRERRVIRTYEDNRLSQNKETGNNCPENSSSLVRNSASPEVKNEFIFLDRMCEGCILDVIAVCVIFVSCLRLEFVVGGDIGD